MTSFSRSPLTWLLLLACLTHLPAQAAKVAGVSLDDTLTVGKQTTTYHGAGVRKKLFIKLYVGSLYLASPTADAASIVAADEAMAIRLDVLSDLLTRKKLVKALDEGFAKSTGGNTQAIQPQIDQMLSFMQDKISPGSRYTLAYEPGVGTHISRNGESLTVIEGLPFKQALFGIWLSDQPAQDSLKAAMLGN
ncbi:chalcone isomerase family protein [Granulosicoccus sp. 3-233]|uniref:chalcone isomerase family protein n=1 Tax=Granulosicoccus sp. 3-233 TaxID=3417969 RepID=UPI003D341B48